MKFELYFSQNQELYNMYKDYSFFYLPGDSGLDLLVPEDTIISAKSKVLLDLKVKTQLCSYTFPYIHKYKDDLGKNKYKLTNKKYYSYFMMPRSSMGAKTPLIMANSIGLIDSNYLGTLKIPLYNTSDQDYFVKKGIRLVQLVKPNLEQMNKTLLKNSEIIRNTERGEGGFGSTN